MNTFLPYPSFLESVKVLDNRRLGKQRVECKTIVSVLEATKNIPNAKPAWRNHPATRMWENNIDALKMYTNLCILEWIHRGFNNSIPLYKIEGKTKTFETSVSEINERNARHAMTEVSEIDIILPWWNGIDKFHNSHKSNLVRKMHAHYHKFFPEVDASIPYWWPSEHTEQ